MNINQSTASLTDRKTFFISMFILAVMFFIFGLVSWVNSILIPYFKIACELTHFQSYFVTFAFYIAYFVMAIPSGLLLKKVGFKKGYSMVSYSWLSEHSFCALAALTRLYGIFLLGLYSIGTGRPFTNRCKPLCYHHRTHGKCSSTRVSWEYSTNLAE